MEGESINYLTVRNCSVYFKELSEFRLHTFDVDEDAEDSSAAPGACTALDTGHEVGASACTYLRTWGLYGSDEGDDGRHRAPAGWMSSRPHRGVGKERDAPSPSAQTRVSGTQTDTCTRSFEPAESATTQIPRFGNSHGGGNSTVTSKEKRVHTSNHGLRNSQNGCQEASGTGGAPGGKSTRPFGGRMLCVPVTGFSPPGVKPSTMFKMPTTSVTESVNYSATI
ncbi:hypothetical protein DFH07DRAFT_774004 [Mycena maculata]|uniref:Uncharacterized protein n=1 Tax=Mycena maculata TaxID=230809 RepID=A0AAD7J3D5_9AGAR|nr:hypothetical protein DFH07DRAFT_774004 [Mycena maculata]